MNLKLIYYRILNLLGFVKNLGRVSFVIRTFPKNQKSQKLQFRPGHSIIYSSATSKLMKLIKKINNLIITIIIIMNMLLNK